jgi:putative lipoic acid-binding regulatory protein
MIDSTKAIMQFPCSFPIKIIGHNTDAFETLVIEIVRRHVPYLDEGIVTSRASTGGKYRSITATFIAHSRAQLDALYTELSGHEQVLMVL